MTLLYHFHDEKALFKGPNFGPLWNFSENSSVLVRGGFPKEDDKDDDDSMLCVFIC